MTRSRTTAYDRRRYLTLVEVLAQEQSPDMGVYALCELWGVEPVWDDDEFLDFKKTAQRLAQHVMDYHRRENSE